MKKYLIVYTDKQIEKLIENRYNFNILLVEGIRVLEVKNDASIEYFALIKEDKIEASIYLTLLISKLKVSYIIQLNKSIKLINILKDEIIASSSTTKFIINEKEKALKASNTLLLRVNNLNKGIIISCEENDDINLINSYYPKASALNNTAYSISKVANILSKGYISLNCFDDKNYTKLLEIVDSIVIS